ncbi:MAG: SRPBCC domain-containing protein [Nitrosomonadales bacterium]|nr:SRPBCC domain-containing protein [Nitrosomonadales bacterium]
MSIAENTELSFSRVFDAPRALVWQAWTDPKHIEQWWGPNGFTGKSCTMDLRAGGYFDLTLFAPDGVCYPCRGRFNEIVEFERIVYDGEVAEGHPCGAGLPPHARVTVTFAERNRQTTITLHTRFMSAAKCEAAAQAGYRQGWEDSLQRLAEILK